MADSESLLNPGAVNDTLRLTDFMDVATLQEIQDSFSSVANVRAIITDAEGNILTQPNPTADFLKRQNAIAQAEETQPGDRPKKEGREYVAPIMVNGQRLGTIRMSPATGSAAFGLEDGRLSAIALKSGIEGKQLKTVLAQLIRARNTRPSAIQFLFLMANAVARLCYQEFELRQHINEMQSLYTLATMLANTRDLSAVLQKTAEVVTQVMGTKAASIRLIDEDHDLLVIKATFNLSPQYRTKGPLRLSKAAIDAVALGPQGYEYVRDMSTDPRVQYPDEAKREGIVSSLSAGLRYKGKAIGALRVYTDHEATFSAVQINLLKAVASQAAAAIENARLLAERIEAEQLEQQVRMAGQVQQRMVPQESPSVPGLGLASVYVPAQTLGGDFFDFIELPGDNWGIVIADVSGKGIPASLTMAAVRAALRAQVDNVFYLYEVMHRLNLMVYRDTNPAEFVSLFYGVYDAHNRKLTYCNAGHLPPLLLRDGKVVELEKSNLVLGVDPGEQYEQAVVDLQPKDGLLLYTDGLNEGMNFNREMFGRQRVIDSFARFGAQAPGQPEVVAQNMLWELRKFAGMAKRSDDVTMIVACVK